MYFNFFGYKIPVEHMKKESCYNNNYYRLPEEHSEGDDRVCFNKDDVLLEECCEDYNYYTYKIGRFENGKFISNIEFDFQEPMDSSDGLVYEND